MFCIFCVVCIEKPFVHRFIIRIRCATEPNVCIGLSVCASYFFKHFSARKSLVAYVYVSNVLKLLAYCCKISIFTRAIDYQCAFVLCIDKSSACEDQTDDKEYALFHIALQNGFTLNYMALEVTLQESTLKMEILCTKSVFYDILTECGVCECSLFQLTMRSLYRQPLYMLFKQQNQKAQSPDFLIQLLPLKQ